MRSLMLVLSVVAVVMTADAFSSRSSKNLAEIRDAVRLAKLYEEINAIEGRAVGYRGYTERQNRIYNFFVRLDVDGVNGITQSDYDAIMAKLDKLENLNEAQQAFANGIVDLGWQFFFKNIAGTIDQFTENIEGMIANNTFPFWCNNVFAVFLIAVDANEDGLVSWEEYEPVYQALFADADCCDTSFKAADKDNSRSLTLSEYSTYAASYFLSDQNDGSQCYWGTIRLRPQQ